MRPTSIPLAIALVAAATLAGPALAQGSTPPASPPGDNAPDTGGNRVTVGLT